MTDNQREPPPPPGGRTEPPDPEAPTLLGAEDRPQPVRRPGPIRIPNYRILELLGAGGMGEVWAAEQEQPIQRRVALKVIKLGMDSREIVARFQYERRALALMSHPSIAAVYEAGTTSDGRPYFAMEYVAGEPITDYCDRYGLGVRERLELFLKVCDGVQHAHQKGIIHRDIKPSNVLVTIQDQEAVPKIVDFGLAKAISQPMTQETRHTAIGSILGTLEYMSPEQFELTGLDVDTRTDIYSLGVLLYELLVGSVPFEKGAPGAKHLDEMRRVIREEDPAKPSARLSTIHGTATGGAPAGDEDHAALVKRIRGDLDWIALKALAKDRTRRYETANALAMDVRRHLANEPVLARPPSAVYKAGKFVRRHRVGVAAGLAVALAIVAGSIGTTAGLLRALRAERQANLEAETARQVSDFLVDLFRVAEPDRAQGETITARQLLDEGSRRISHELRQQPMTRARLMSTMGTVYRLLGLYEESRDLLEDSLEMRRSQVGDDSLEVADSLAALAALDMLEGRYDSARARAEQAVAIREDRGGPQSPELADAVTLLGWILANQGQHAAARPLFERGLDIRRATLAEESTAVAESHHGLGFSHWRSGEYDLAEGSLRLALETYERVFGPEDSRISGVLNDLAALYQETGRDRAALPLLERALTIKERVLGPRHPDVASSLNNLAIAYDRDERPADAEPLFKRALNIIEEAHGAGHESTAVALGNVAWITYRRGESAAAEALYEEAYATFLRTVGRVHRNVAILMQDWSVLYSDQGRFEEAERLLVEAAEIWEVTVGAGHPNLASCLTALADLYRRQGKLDQAAAVEARVDSISG